MSAILDGTAGFDIVIANVAAIVSLLLGLYAIVSPRGALRLVGLSLDPSRVEGISEVRATYGGVFTGVSLAALLLGTPEAFLVLGAGWLGALVLRVASTALDRVPVSANLPGIATEGLIAAGCLLPALLN